MCNHLRQQGHDPQPLGPLVALVPDEASAVSLFTRTSTDEASESLRLLDDEVASIRKQINNLKTSMTNAYRSHSHPGVTAFYNDEVFLNHNTRLILNKQFHLVMLFSDKKAPFGAGSSSRSLS